MLKKSHNFPKVSIVNLSQSCYPGQGWGSGSIQACGCFTWRLEDNPPTVLVFSSKSPGLCTNPVFNPKCSLLLQLLISYWIKSWPVGALVLSSNVLPFHQNICGLQEPAAGRQGPPPRVLTPPQLRVRARSFPVPRGRTPTGGWGLSCSSSRIERIQPT